MKLIFGVVLGKFFFNCFVDRFSNYVGFFYRFLEGGFFMFKFVFMLLYVFDCYENLFEVDFMEVMIDYIGWVE